MNKPCINVTSALPYPSPHQYLLSEFTGKHHMRTHPPLASYNFGSPVHSCSFLTSSPEVPQSRTIKSHTPTQALHKA